MFFQINMPASRPILRAGAAPGERMNLSLIFGVDRDRGSRAVAECRADDRVEPFGSREIVFGDGPRSRLGARALRKRGATT